MGRSQKLQAAPGGAIGISCCVLSIWREEWLSFLRASLSARLEWLQAIFQGCKNSISAAACWSTCEASVDWRIERRC
jgi:hypothetical protein